MTTQDFHYEGEVYVRPASRGVVLGDPTTSEARDLVDVIEQLTGGEGTFGMRIQVSIDALSDVKENFPSS